jgi:predicted phosphodiesterase
VGGTTLLIGDTHGHLPDFSSLKKYVADVHLIISLGDHVDEYIPYSSRRLFLERLSESFRELSPRVMLVEGNHDRKCSHYEKKRLRNGTS